jgi:hypothetical protein
VRITAIRVKTEMEREGHFLIVCFFCESGSVFNMTTSP